MRVINTNKTKAIVQNALEEYSNNELIFISKMYHEKLENIIKEMNFYKIIQRMCDSGELVKASKGVYYKPQKSRYGIVPLPEETIIQSFTKNEKGTIVGYKLYNLLNLTTQIAKNVEIYSSAIDQVTKSIQSVKIIKKNLNFNKENTEIIQMLEVLDNFNEIQDLNYSVFIDYCDSFSQKVDSDYICEIIESVSYPKRTISFLKEILEFHNVPNELGKYLSTMSVYKHPTMEEIYEFARA